MNRGQISESTQKSGWSRYKALRLFQVSCTPGYSQEPPPKPVCSRFARCTGCPYPAHGFLCWTRDGECLRTRVEQIDQRGGTT